jgi:hypothetical protein
MQDIGFDVISDLNLSPEDSFNWEGKSTSLYCLVAGNVSSDLRTTLQTLAHLGRFYQGVFYVPGTLEYKNSTDISERTEQLISLIKQLPSVHIMHHSVVIVDGIAVVGANGWNNSSIGTLQDMVYTAARFDDMTYLKLSIEKLQRHLDVKKVIVVTNAVPDEKLYFGETPNTVENQIPLKLSLSGDTEKKVTSWVFGSYDKFVDATVDNINYVNNPYSHKSPYWAKRISISV